MEWANSALIQDEVLLNVALGLDRDISVGPAFVASLGSLIEAVVLHEHVYFDPTRRTARETGAEGTVHDVLRRSSIVRRLMDEGALKVFPAFETVTPDLQESGTGYTHGAFLADYCWNTVSFSHSSGEGQKHLYEIMLYLAKHHPELLAADRLLSRIDDEPETAAIRSARSLIEQGVPVENISDLEGMSRRTRAFLELTRSLGLNVYLVDTAIPFQLERVRVSNSRVREIFTTIEQRIERFDQEFDGPEFCNVRIPPLLQIALSQAQDNKKALIDEVLTLRARHRKFREYLTEHDRAWKAAETRLQRTRLHREFVNAWETIVRSEDRPRTRLIYTIWDVVKNPTKIPQAVGDILATKGRELSISSRVAGLHTFWREISQSPIPERNHRLLARLFPQQIAPDVWDSARKYYAAVDERLPKVLEPSA